VNDPDLAPNNVCLCQLSLGMTNGGNALIPKVQELQQRVLADPEQLFFEII
jgi:hypothetical protein